MPCYTPLKGYASIDRTDKGKRSLVFSAQAGYYDKPIDVPCGQCIGCKLERSRQWAIRMQHESKLYQENCFITLTYDNEHLPEDYSLNLVHYQLFMKKLRSYYAPKKIRFYHCGEYGDINRRPHYHAAIFNHDFRDKIQYKQSPGGHPLYTSAALSKLWEYGHADIGELTFDSAAYIARYCTKKITGDLADDHYTTTHPITGEIIQQSPEYATMSRRPGIGALWYEKYKHDTYKDDTIIINGKAVKPPKFYDTKYKEDHPDEYSKIKAARILKATSGRDAQLDPADRLHVQNYCAESRAQLLKREL